MTYDAEHIFLCLFALCVSSFLGICLDHCLLFIFIDEFKIVLCLFQLPVFIKLPDTCFSNIFSQTVVCTIFLI